MKHDYRASVFEDTMDDRWKLAFVSESSGEWVFLALEAMDAREARYEGARVLGVDAMTVSVDHRDR